MGPDGGRLDGPYGATLVVPEGALDQWCTVSMMFSNTLPGPEPEDAYPVSLCVWLDLDPCDRFQQPATLLVPLTGQDCAGCKGVFREGEGEAWDSVPVVVNGQGQALLEVVSPGYYTVVAPQAGQ